MRKIRKIHNNKIFMYLAVIVGSILVAFANTVFLTPLNINSGGLNGIGVIIMNFVPETAKMLAYNIVIYGLTVVLWLVGFFFVSKEFAFKTLISSIVFPIATSLFTIVPGTKDFAAGITDILLSYGETTGTFMLFAMAGGVIIGFGVAITFLGGGSTGGVDAITFILEKYCGIKQSIASFMVDGLIVALGLCILSPIDSNTYLLPCLVGILSAAVTALLIDIVYVAFQTVFQVDVISEKWDEISKFAQDELGRGATIIPVKGGFKHTDKIMVRVVLSKAQIDDLREYISKIDSKAFITITQTKMVLGEGFRANK